MRDEYDARIWNDHHQAYAASLARESEKTNDSQTFRSKPMNHYFDFRVQILSILAAISLSSLAVLGTVGPIDAATPVDAQTADAGIAQGRTA